MGGKALSLSVANPGLIPSTSYGLLSTGRTDPCFIARNKPSPLLGWSGKKKEEGKGREIGREVRGIKN